MRLRKPSTPVRHFIRAATAVLIVGALASGCGVRGDPQPPLQPAEIGHGQPSFKRQTDESDFSGVPDSHVSAPESAPTPTPTPEPSSRREGAASPAV